MAKGRETVLGETMPIYSVSHGAAFAKRCFERSPVLALETDLASPESIPAAVRSAADAVVLQSLDSFGSGKVPRSTDGVITWLAGDRLLKVQPRTSGENCVSVAGGAL